VTPVRFGVHPVDFGPRGRDPREVARDLRDVARAADDGGLDHVYLMDHFLGLDFRQPADSAIPEGYVSLGYLAALTERVRLGLLVTGVTYRHPGVLGQQVATLDALSGGRAVLGIGAAWYEREHLAMGVPFPPLAERFERLEESLRLIKQLWSPDDGPFEGVHYRLAETICEPRPVQPGGPPVLVGGGGERKTLRLVAQHADASNLICQGPESLDEVAHKLGVLDAHCADLGRDPAEVARTLLYLGDPFDPAFRPAMDHAAALGVSAVTVAVYDHPAAATERLAALAAGGGASP